VLAEGVFFCEQCGAPVAAASRVAGNSTPQASGAGLAGAWLLLGGLLLRSAILVLHYTSSLAALKGNLDEFIAALALALFGLITIIIAFLGARGMHMVAPCIFSLLISVGCGVDLVQRIQDMIFILSPTRSTDFISTHPDFVRVASLCAVGDSLVLLGGLLVVIGLIHAIAVRGR